MEHPHGHSHASAPRSVAGSVVTLDGDAAYRIDGLDELEPFLTTVVSSTDLWLFASSCGTLTAGRVDAAGAFLPYLTDDRIHRSVGRAGPVTVLERHGPAGREVWRPFADTADPAVRRAATKTMSSDLLVLEERHAGWGATFRQSWVASPTYGWVRRCELVPDDGVVLGDVTVLDGLLDVMPAEVDLLTELRRSNLVDAYKRSELADAPLTAVYSLESLVTDRAEPGEALSATVIWADGLPDATLHLDERAVDAVRRGDEPPAPALLTGRPGAFLLRARATSVGDALAWRIVADTPLDHAMVADRLEAVRSGRAGGDLDGDVAAGRAHLRTLLAGADAEQRTADPVADGHHRSNVLFNCMRGGVFVDGHRVPVDDLVAFVAVRNRPTHDRHADRLTALGPTAEIDEVRAVAEATRDPDLVRLVAEYLPLTFSRRHGDPSRPWNAFAIRVHDEVGRPVLSYEGNWRDIFQNWEALLASHPRFLPGVVAKFVNASTPDGYNPYRISRDGIDWEVPDPDDPWSNIGYWGDHQIIYLLRLIDLWERCSPGEIDRWLTEAVFTYADVPYRVADHADMVRDPHDTIRFDERRAARSAEREADLGTDGRLVVATSGELLRVGLLEKLVVPALGKLSAYVPGAGIWMNTQRPEWNDANNALAGNGVSVVTLAHLAPYLDRLRAFAGRVDGPVAVSPFVADWLADLVGVFGRHPVTPTDDVARRRMLDELGHAGSAVRHRIDHGLTDATVELDPGRVVELCDLAGTHLEAAFAAARRDDGLFHSYSLVGFPDDDRAVVRHLGTMLEGQVAALASGRVGPAETVELVDAVMASGLHRPDQDSLMLYPVVERPAFVDRNRLSDDHLDRVPFLRDPTDEWRHIVVTSSDGGVRFRPGLAHAGALSDALDEIDASPGDAAAVLDVYEELFGHASFTGRSGAMYGYEGIGSIYWHMVSKFLLAVQEIHARAIAEGEDDAVVEALASGYRRVRDGLGFRKDPAGYGAFPTDCYSHTPMGAGAKQPGMTGQVKEEILARGAELGLLLVDGTLVAVQPLLPVAELFGPGGDGVVELTWCGVPVEIRAGRAPAFEVDRSDGTTAEVVGDRLGEADARELFARTGRIRRLRVTVPVTGS